MRLFLTQVLPQPSNGQANRLQLFIFDNLPQEPGIQKFERAMDPGLSQAIQQVIMRRIAAGTIFNAHTVIDILISDFSDDYRAGRIGDESTRHYHSRISKQIGVLEKTLPISRVGRNSFSRNVHNRYSQNHCWVKE